ncbi:MAG: hypothetical protein RLZZ188_1318 [Verrucomicrobiota bacterium]|jgi:uncharacterized protein (DUF2062 family)
METRDAAPEGRESFWRRRVTGPVRRQLTLGVTPDRLAVTFAVGAVCSLFPFLGFTALLNLGVGLALRLNQPVLQTLNQLLGPVQLALILVYVRAGEVLWGASGQPFTVGEMLAAFSDLSAAEFLARFGWAGLHAFTAWLLTAPFLAAAVYLPARPLLRRAAARLATVQPAPAGA